MADDVTRDLVVAVQAISYSGGNKASLLSKPIHMFIDSTDPNIWLPDSAVKAFESAFDLTVDDTSGLYLINDTHHTTLLNSNAEVSFRLSDVLQGGDSVTITLPYEAFGLQAKYPLVENASYYFPLRLAANDSQYTLGRTFLQEAYLTVDYERRLFNISQCTWSEGAKQNIVTIQSKDSESDTDTKPSSGPSTPIDDNSETAKPRSSLTAGGIAGVVVGVIGLIAIVAGSAFIPLRRRLALQAAQAVTNTSNPDLDSLKSGFGELSVLARDQVMMDQESPQGELAGDDHHIHQLHSETATPQPTKEVIIYELPANKGPTGDLGVPPLCFISGEND